jgi:hypothetical protein
VADFEGPNPTNSPRSEATKNAASLKRHSVSVLDFAPEGTRTPNLLIRSQRFDFTFNDILRYFRGKPSAGAGLSGHSYRTLLVETPPQTAPT